MDHRKCCLGKGYEGKHSLPHDHQVKLRFIQVLRNDPDEADKFKEEDSVVINPTEEEIDEQIVKMEARRARVKAEKKAAKAAKKGIASASAVPANDGFKRPGLPGGIQVSNLILHH